MNAAAWSLASSVLGVFAGVLVLVGFAWKLGKPHIEKYLKELASSMTDQTSQLTEIHRVVAENGHKNPAKPSLPDRMASMELRLEHRLTAQDDAIGSIDGKLDAHLVVADKDRADLIAVKRDVNRLKRTR